jgi:hypothetical protein
MDTIASISDGIPIDPITSIISQHQSSRSSYGQLDVDDTSGAKCSGKTGPRIAVVNIRTKTTFSILSSKSERELVASLPASK